MEGNGGVDGARVGMLFETARSAHPELLLDLETFAAHVARTRDAIDGPFFAEDLYLAAACAARVDAAARLFRDRFGPIIRRVVAGLIPASAFRDDIEQQIYEHLLVGGRTTGEPQIQTYGGQAPLGAWLAVVAQRAVLMALRADSTRARARDGVARERLTEAVFDCAGESAVIRDEARPLVKEALARAWAELPSRDRTVFHLHVVGGAGVERLGKMYRVSPSTISRWIARARAALLSKTGEVLSAELRLTPAESDSLMALVISQLDISAGDLPLPTSSG